MTLIDKIRAIIPNGSISQDMIAGFPYETEHHKDTLSLMEYVSITLVICIRTQNAQEH
jgi:tRNA-2-methylthio-N6-dimethylallyladenosine synthase